MIKKKSLFILVALIVLIMITITPSISMAIQDPITDPDAYKPGGVNGKDANIIASKAGRIFNAITTIGIIVAVITIVIIGIKYMIGSIEEKAEYKKTMIPYLIGVVMIGGISTILKVIVSIVEGLG